MEGNPPLILICICVSEILVHSSAQLLFCVAMLDKQLQELPFCVEQSRSDNESPIH